MMAVRTLHNSLKSFWEKVPNLLMAGIFSGLPIGSTGADPNKPNSILQLFAERIAAILTFVAWPLAFVGIIYSVYLLIANSDNPDALKTTKKNLGYIITGIFLIIFAAIIFNAIVGFLRS